MILSRNMLKRVGERQECLRQAAGVSCGTGGESAEDKPHVFSQLYDLLTPLC